MAPSESHVGVDAHADTDACARLAKAMGLPDPSVLGADVRWLSLEGCGRDRLRFSVGAAGRALTFCLLAGVEGGAFVRTSQLRLIYETSSIDGAEEGFLRALAHAVGDRDLDELIALLVEVDGEHWLATSDAMLPAADLATHAEPDHRAMAPAWCSGFTERDWYLEPTDPIYTSSRHVLLEHGDRECWQSHPWPEPGKLNYYNHPWVALPQRHASEPRPELRQLISEIGETEVVLGSRDALLALGDAAIALADEVDVYIVNHLCTPVVIGDDLDALGHRIERGSGKPVIHMTRDAKARGQTVEPLYERARLAAGFFEQDLEPDTVNLIGFPAAYRREELVPFLATLGIRPNAEVVPDLDFRRLTEVLRAPVSIVCADLTPAEAVVQLTRGGAHRVVEVGAPMGWRRSRACLRRVAEGLGRLDALDRWVEDPELGARFQELRAAAAEERLALVLSADQLPGLLEPNRGGLPLIELIVEMGFGLDLLVWGGEPSSLPSGIGDVQIQAFSTRDELQQLLTDGRASAAYSDTYFDWRLTTAGKAQFSLRHFEMGSRGALRTIDGLLAVCRLPFYRRYARYLPKRKRA